MEGRFKAGKEQGEGLNPKKKVTTGRLKTSSEGERALQQ